MRFIISGARATADGIWFRTPSGDDRVPLKIVTSTDQSRRRLGLPLVSGAA